MRKAYPPENRASNSRLANAKDNNSRRRNTKTVYRKLGEKLAQREQRNLWERKRLGRSVDLIDLLANCPVELLEV